MKNVYDIALFDLDGTLINSGPAIISSISYALQKEGIPLPDPSEMRRFVGPPIQKGLMKICGISDEKSKQMAKKYREYYETHFWNKNTLYDGMENLLSQLHDSGYLLATATSRPESSARRIINYHGLDKLFDVIVAAKDDKPHTPKKELIQTAINLCEKLSGRQNLSAVMVGDTFYDMEGARLASVASIGVTYGYGTRQELLDNGADFLASNSTELLNLLMV